MSGTRFLASITEHSSRLADTHHIKAGSLLWAVRAYHEVFRPSGDPKESYVMLYVSAICADAEREGSNLIGSLDTVRAGWRACSRRATRTN
jgi:hypothetical protein